MQTPAELAWLIAAVAKGDEAAFERLYAATRARLYGIVLRILRRQDLAEQALEGAYVRIWHSAGQFDPALSAPIAWMSSIVHDRAIDLVRKKTESLIEEEPQATEVAANSDSLSPREMTEELRRLLECLGQIETDRQKLVLLAYYDGWSREQLAEKFAAPVSTVKTWIRRSMLDIRECLKPYLMAYTEDHIALAAEYALGSLDADERVQVETMMAVDKEFAAVVQAWELRLGVLNQMVGSVEPRPVVWENITAAIGHAKIPQEPLVLPETAPPTPPVLPKAPQATAVDDRKVVGLARRVKLWRMIAFATGALAAALLAMLALQLYRPDVLPDAMRPAPRIQTEAVPQTSQPPADE